MSYKIEEIEGVGPKFAVRLAAVGITTTSELLSRCATPAGRKEVSASAAVRPDLVLKWANMADLLRLDGMTGQSAELLKKSGVDTVKELAQRNAANLHAKLTEVNSGRKVALEVPSAEQVAAFVAQAKTLPGALSY